MLDKESLIQKIIKLEEKKEVSDRLIATLDERAGAGIVDSDSSLTNGGASISPVQHECEQIDPFFARKFTYTTNVSILIMLKHFGEKYNQTELIQ